MLLAHRHAPLFARGCGRRQRKKLEQPRDEPKPQEPAQKTEATGDGKKVELLGKSQEILTAVGAAGFPADTAFNMLDLHVRDVKHYHFKYPLDVDIAQVYTTLCGTLKDVKAHILDTVANEVVRFGKHNNETVGFIIQKDIAYLKWCFEHNQASSSAGLKRLAWIYKVTSTDYSP